MRKSIVSALAITLLGAVTVLPAGAARPSSAGDVLPACTPSQAPGVAHCGAIQLLNPGVNWQGVHGPSTNAKGGKKPPSGGGSPSGYFPGDIESAYNLASAIDALAKSSYVPTVAIVDAYNDPNAIADVATYRATFQLPSCDGSTGSGCVTQVNQTGGTQLPRNNTSWSEEISLDLDMVSATCPSCHILLVEAKSASMNDLGTAVNYAATQAQVISNSYGASASSSDSSYNNLYFKHSGVVITASAGDSGYGAEYPASSPYVTAVGGTTLTASNSTKRGWSETVWSGTGSGCSTYDQNPGWQPTTLCSGRTVADVAADANPSTGVAVYDTYGQTGWLVFGGTSVASPIIASIYALAGNTSSVTAASLYANSSSLNKVTSGSNALNCSTYLCNAADSLPSSSGYGGYNGPTGNGTPNSTVGF